jgi:hypothetical protein
VVGLEFVNTQGVANAIDLPARNHAIPVTMNPLADFHHRRGASFYETPQALWCPAGAFSIYSAPSSLAVGVDRREMESALRTTRRLLAIASPPRDTGLEGKAFILRDKNYGPHSLQRQFRQQVKKSSQHCGVAPIDWTTLSRSALPVNRSLCLRGRELHSGIDREEIWLRFCDAAAATPGMEAWGVSAAGELLAYMVVLEWNGFCHGLHMNWSGSRPEWHPTHLLYYETARALMARPHIHAFGTGRQTLPANPGVDRFKTHAGFQPEPIPLAIVAHPRWRIFLEKFHACFPTALRRRFPILRNLEAPEAAALVRRAGKF